MFKRFFRKSIGEKEIKELLEAVEMDTWCQECGNASTATAVIKVLRILNMDVPKWLEERAGDNTEDFEAMANEETHAEYFKKLENRNKE